MIWFDHPPSPSQSAALHQFTVANVATLAQASATVRHIQTCTLLRGAHGTACAAAASASLCCGSARGRRRRRRGGGWTEARAKSLRDIVYTILHVSGDAKLALRLLCPGLQHTAKLEVLRHLAVKLEASQSQLRSLHGTDSSALAEILRRRDPERCF